MANTFLTVQEIARAALPILHENLVFPALSYKEFCTGMGKKGDVVQIKKPAVYSAKEFTSQINVQDVKENSVLVTLDKIADVSVELTAKEMALNLEDFTRQVVAPAAVAIAEKINLRITPELNFEYDNAMERGANISELLKKTAIPETLDSDTFEQ